MNASLTLNIQSKGKTNVDGRAKSSWNVEKDRKYTYSDFDFKRKKYGFQAFDPPANGWCEMRASIGEAVSYCKAIQI